MKNYLLLLGALLFCFSACQRPFSPTTTRVQQYRIEPEQALVEDSSIIAFLAPFKTQLEAEMNVVLGESTIELTKARPESSLGNWAADVTHIQCEKLYGKSIDFAIVNYGGLRISQLPKGPITRGKIFELMPFDNMLVVLEASGSVVHELFDLMADHGGWPISHSVRYSIKNDKAENIRINGLPLALKKIYRIGLTDFVANGGDRCFFLKDQPRVVLSMRFRDALMAFVEEETKAGRGIFGEVEGRVVESR